MLNIFLPRTIGDAVKLKPMCYCEPYVTGLIWEDAVVLCSLTKPSCKLRTSDCTIRGTVEVNGNLKLMTYRFTALVNPQWSMSMSMNMNFHDRRSQFFWSLGFRASRKKMYVEMENFNQRLGTLV